MPTRTRAGASARKAPRKRAPSRKTARRAKSAKPRKPTPHKTIAALEAKPKKPAAPRRNGATADQRVTPWGVITVRSGRPLGYTPELKAHIRYRVEQTPESEYSIAADFGMHHTSLKRLIKREGWVRHNPPPKRDITPVMRIAAAVDAMVGAREAPPTPDPSPPLASLAGGGEQTPTPTLPLAGGGSPTAFAAPSSHVASAPDPSAVDRLEAAVLKELAAVELMRANLGGEPLRPLEAQVTARTLSVLTETLAKLRRLRLGARPQSGSIENDDDMPADIDEFRRALARRIEAFLESREADEDAERAAGAVVVDQPR